MDFAVSCPLVRHWRLISGFCPSARTFAPRFLQTSPRGDSPCVLASPSPPSGWAEDFHLQAAEHVQHTTKPLRGSVHHPTTRVCTSLTRSGGRGLSRIGVRSLSSSVGLISTEKEFRHDRTAPKNCRKVLAARSSGLPDLDSAHDSSANEQATDSLDRCPRCKAGNLRMIEILVPRIGAVAWPSATLGFFKWIPPN